VQAFRSVVVQAFTPVIVQAFIPVVVQAFSPVIVQAFSPVVVQAFRPAESWVRRLHDLLHDHRSTAPAGGRVLRRLPAVFPHILYGLSPPYVPVRGRDHQLLEQLRQTCSLCEFALTAYCFMHDHLHVLATGQSERADLRDFVKRFKQATGFAYRKAHRQTLWQPGYHERILRDDEATGAVVRYILANPIRAGLTKEIGEYAFAGSDVYELAGLLTAWDKQT